VKDPALRWTSPERREFPRSGKARGVARLDGLKTVVRSLPITTAAMLHAADLWATARRRGLSTGDPKKLAIDALCAAHALTLPVTAPDTIVGATANISHVSRFVAGDLRSHLAP
jgi:predicted nucleic acid-binding protein